jgi:hypothetical protein
MARNGPDRLVWRCPLIGEDRKWLVDGQNGAIDPERTRRLVDRVSWKPHASDPRDMMSGSPCYFNT